MGRNANNSAINNLNIQSRVFNASPNSGRMQQNLGRNLAQVPRVTTAQVKQSNADLQAAREQKQRSTKFSQNEKAIMALLLDIANIEAELLKAGYDTDAKIEALIQTGRIDSAKYQKAVLLQQKRGDLGIAAQAAGFQLDSTKMMHKAAQGLQFMQHKHGLDIKMIDAVYAQKKQLATQAQGQRLGQSSQRQLEMAAFRAELNGLPGSGSQPALMGSASGDNWSNNNNYSRANSGGGWLGGIKKLFSFS